MLQFISKIGLFLVICYSSAQGQDIIIQGEVTDAQGNSLYNVNVTVEGDAIGDATDARGKFSFPYTYTKPVQIICSHTGYEGREITLDNKLMAKVKNGTLTIDFEISQEATIIPIDFNITATPDVVYGSEEHSVSDFEFYDSLLVLLTYEKRLTKGSRLLLADSKMKVLSDYEISYTAVGLERDFSGTIMLICEDRVYEVYVNDTLLELVPGKKMDYDTYIKPLIDTAYGQIFFSTWSTNYPAFDYNSYMISDSIVDLIREVADDFMLELCRAEYKYLDGYWKNVFFNWEVRTGVDKEVWACLSTFENGIYYDPLYAPMFVANDTILIFDHYDNMLYKYDMDRNPLDSVSIDYHNPEIEVGNDFEQLLVRDAVTGAMYAVFQRPGGRCYLKKIDLETGEVASEHTLTYDYPADVQVKDGSVYYIYRPFESIQKKYLYKEWLN